MHHGCQKEFQGVVSQRKFFSILYDSNVLGNVIKALQHICCACITNELNVWILVEKKKQSTRMIGFHVIDHKVVYGFIAQQYIQFLQENISKSNINSIDQCYFFVTNKVGVIRNPFWERPQVFEQLLRSVVYTNVKKVFVNFNWFVHILI